MSKLNLGCLHLKIAYNHCAEMSCRNYKNKCPLHCIAGADTTATCNLARASVLSGLSDETRETVDNAIALSPALEQTILLIVELSFADGEAAECEFGHPAMDHHEPLNRPVE